VFEAKNLTKRCFNSVEEFFSHYELPTYNLEEELYKPTIRLKSQGIELRTAFQKEMRLVLPQERLGRIVIPQNNLG
jgi:hypothetical protein